MQNLDFTSMMKKYPLLESGDVSFLNNFFNSEKVQEILAEIEENREKKKKYGILIIILWIITTFPFLYFIKGYRSLDYIFIYSLFSLIGFAIIGYIVGFFIFKKVRTIKGDLMPDFVKKMNGNIEYSEKPKYFTDSLSNLVSIGMLKNYTSVDLLEDSIKYIIGEERDKTGNSADEIVPEEKKTIEITGCEIETSERRTHRTKNGTETYDVVTNHCYMMKINFKNPRYTIKNAIKLFEDVNDNYFKKFLLVFGIEFAIIFLPLGFFLSENDRGGTSNFVIDYAMNNVLFTILALIGIYGIIWFIYSYIKGKNRVKLENIEFEKEFDVYCDDQIESRKLLTPSFMYRLVDYVNKISRERVYELYFVDNYFYLKYNMLKTSGSEGYMEFSPWENVFKNLEDYVEFYLEIKNITALSKDLKLFYYDKGLMSKQIIK